MRRIVLTLLLALLSLAFAPAPLPKAERATHRRSEAALVRECLRRLDELGVKWQIEYKGRRPLVRYRVVWAGFGGSVQPGDGELLRVLRGIVANAEWSLNDQRPGR